MTDNLTVFGTDYTGVTGIKATGTGNGTLTYIRPQGTKSISANGTNIDVTEYASVDVAVPAPSPTLQSKSKTYTPTASQQSETVSSDGGYDGLSSVSITVNAMPSGSVTAPSTITGTSATVSTGTNTLTLSKTVSVTPSVTTAGYVSSGTAGNSSVSLTASVTTQAAQTLYPSTSDQTIASGRYLTGTQTVKAVTTTNLTADNIKSGVTVQVGDSSDSDRVASVTGTYSGGGGSSAKTKTGTFTGNGTRTIDVACDFEPDLVYFTSNPGTTASSGTVAAIIVCDMMTATTYRNNSTSNTTYSIPSITGMNTSGTSYSWRATYASSKVTLYCNTSNARTLLTNNRTYSYTFVKYTS